MSNKIIAIVPAAGIGERAQSRHSDTELPLAFARRVTLPEAKAVMSDQYSRARQAQVPSEIQNAIPPVAAVSMTVAGQAAPFVALGVSDGDEGRFVADPVPLVMQTVDDSAMLPKQYRLLKGEPMLRWAVKALLADPRIEQVRVAVAPHDTWAVKALDGLPRTVLRPCGGPTRCATVTAALLDAALSPDAWVLVHDAARPGLPLSALKRLIDTCLRHHTGGLLALPVADTVKQQSATDAARIEPQTNTAPLVQDTLSRDGLWLAQTPQMFPAGLLLTSLQTAQQRGVNITDEASALEAAGHPPLLVSGSARNFKVTWPEDFELMEKWL